MRFHKTNTTKGNWNPAEMQRAIEAVLDKSMSERKAASIFSVTRSTLKRRVKELKKQGSDVSCASLVQSQSRAYNTTSMKIFTDAEELELVSYCLRASKMGYGLSPIKLRQLAYEYAEKLNKRLPHSRGGRANPWGTNKKAGEDWFRAFMRRHKELAIRKPEPTSIGRMSAFNRHNVDLFYSNIHEVISKHHFEPNRIWNCDETGVATVQIPEDVLAGRGERQVASVTSAERGTLVTMCNAVNACGASIPPFYIFPRVNFKDLFLKNGPPGCVGTAQSTGWMVETTFIEWFHHFLNSVHPSKTNPVLLLLDNHETHLSIEFVDLAADNGVVVVTIPPHTSHKLQPLDISVYGPFKRLYNREMDTWHSRNGGKPVTIYELAEISGNAWSKASVPANIISGFAAAGVYPFSPDKWQDKDFCLAQVTDRPNPEVAESEHVQLQSAEPENTNSHPDDTTIGSVPVTPSPHLAASSVNVISSPPVATLMTSSISPRSGNPVAAVTPLSIRPLPTAPARKQERKGCRKKLSSTVLTSTPVKEALREQQRERKAKKLALDEKRNKPKKCTRKPVLPKPKLKKKRAKKSNSSPTTSDEEHSDVNAKQLCDDNSDDDIEDGTSSRPLVRRADANKSESDCCTVCGEFGRDRELWYRCTICGLWAHEACTSATSASNYVCDYCE